MNPILTVFTPTFNRAHTLHVCYESLKRQSSKGFKWLIIDDGSTDHTRELVAGWISEGIVPIRYHYQGNQGMHGAHNTAYELIDTELNMCIDSDDYVADGAVERIISFWRENGSERVAGIVALDADPAGNVIGTRLPDGLQAATLTHLYGIHRIRGDKKLVYRSGLTRDCPPYPIFQGEKYCPLSYKYLLIDQVHPLLIMDEVVCHVEYRDDGSSMNMISQYRRNPRGFAFFRKAAMIHAPTFKERLRESIHYVSSNLMIRNYRFWMQSPCKWTTLLAIPFGSILYMYIMKTSKATVFRKG